MTLSVTPHDFDAVDKRLLNKQWRSFVILLLFLIIIIKLQ